MDKTIRLNHLFASAAALFGAMVHAAPVVDPTHLVAGVSQLELSQQWWQWALIEPAATNPLLDTTGASAQMDNSGPVFFIAGNLGGTSVRTFNAPANKPLFFPIVNSFDAEVPGAGCDLQCAFGFLSDIGGATNLHAVLDGQNLLNFPSFRQTSNAFFPLVIPVDNAFGFPPPYVGTLDAVSDGYWLALEGLSPGQHTLQFGGSIPGVSPIEVTAIINAVPEPATLSLLLLAAVAAVGSTSVRRFQTTKLQPIADSKSDGT